MTQSPQPTTLIEFYTSKIKKKPYLKNKKNVQNLATIAKAIPLEMCYVAMKNTIIVYSDKQL